MFIDLYPSINLYGSKHTYVHTQSLNVYRRTKFHVQITFIFVVDVGLSIDNYILDTVLFLTPL